MKKTVLGFMVIIFFTFGCAHDQKLYYGADTMLPGTERNMKTSGFWIDKLSDPDQVIHSINKIAELNMQISSDESLCVNDILAMKSQISGDFVLTKILEKYEYLLTKKFYFKNCNRVSKNYMKQVKERMNTKPMPEMMTIEFGFVTNYTSIKSLPVREIFTIEQGDIQFDKLQFSALDIGTPLAVLHSTIDEEWLYVISPMIDGWVEAKNVGRCNRNELKNYFDYGPFAVVTSAKCEIHNNEKLSDYYDYARMGVKFPVTTFDNTNVVQVQIPVRNKYGYMIMKTAFVCKDDVNIGYLPYTQRNIIKQAFKLLNAPYGWGGMYGEQDCSKFICEIFSTVGINLPRNSYWQSKTGVLAGEFLKTAIDEEKLEVISENGIPGASVFYLPGHIMLFIGNHNDTPYVIHSVWAYKEKTTSGEIIRMINRVAVSNLLFGEGTKKGTWLNRIIKLCNLVYEQRIEE